MKIGPVETSPIGPQTAAERKAEGGKAIDKRGADAGAAASAQVQLSPTAAALASQGIDEASFDQSKVDRISAAIRDGQFQVNAEVIADKLIANAQDLLGKNGT
jgi:negative regulator of flagellin synthesis FlgM